MLGHFVLKYLDCVISFGFPQSPEVFLLIVSLQKVKVLNMVRLWRRTVPRGVGVPPNISGKLLTFPAGRDLL